MPCTNHTSPAIVRWNMFWWAPFGDHRTSEPPNRSLICHDNDDNANDMVAENGCLGVAGRGGACAERRGAAEWLQGELRGFAGHQRGQGSGAVACAPPGTMGGHPRRESAAGACVHMHLKRLIVCKTLRYHLLILRSVQQELNMLSIRTAIRVVQGHWAIFSTLKPCDNALRALGIFQN